MPFSVRTPTPPSAETRLPKRGRRDCRPAPSSRRPRQLRAARPPVAGQFDGRLPSSSPAMPPTVVLEVLRDELSRDRIGPRRFWRCFETVCVDGYWVIHDSHPRSFRRFSSIRPRGASNRRSRRVHERCSSNPDSSRGSSTNRRCLHQQRSSPRPHRPPAHERGMSQHRRRHRSSVLVSLAPPSTRVQTPRIVRPRARPTRQARDRGPARSSTLGDEEPSIETGAEP